MLSDYLQTVDWSRAQFAMTAIYHWLFVPLTLGLGFILAIMETLYVRTGDEFWKRTTKFWMRLFGINFAIGVATGIILEFEFGTNWSNYSHFVGDIFGAPLAVEGIMAFFMESTFIAIMFFGWNKVSKGFHLTATWLTAIGANLSALWILVANAWMQYPVGCTFNLETVRNEMTSFWDVLFSPVAMNKFFHTVTSSFVLASLFVVGVSAWYLLRRREQKMARKSIAIASAFGFIFALITATTGDRSGAVIARVQPMKLAAMEALYDGSQGAPLTAIGIVKPEAERTSNEDAFYFKIDIPKLLSIMSFRDADAYVAGINDLVNGNERYGVMSAGEKIERGRVAVGAPRRGVPARILRLLRLRLPRRTAGHRSRRAAAVLLVPRDGGRRMLLHPAAGSRLVVKPQGPAGGQTLAAMDRRMVRTAGLPRVSGGLGAGRSRPAAVGHSGPDARGHRRVEDRQHVGHGDLLHLPRALHGAADRRTEHSVPSD